MQMALFSRLTVTSLPKMVPGLTRLSIGKLNHMDIQLYLTNKLAMLVKNELLPPGSNDKDTIDRLALKADGMFLWARLMTCYLRSPALSLSQRRDAITEIGLPEG